MSALIALAAAWTAWGALHSLLVAGPLRRAAERALGRYRRAYRLLYNLAALVTLVPVVLLARSVNGPVIFHWWGAGLPVGAILFVLALLLFIAGGRTYDMAAFLGLRQIRSRDDVGASGLAKAGDTGLHATGGISRRGVLALMRHPWYTAGILLLWVGPKNAATLVTAVVLTVYLVVGAHLEERRLVVEFGAEYRRYRNEVSMFLPFRWIRGRITGP